jgi:hypothetical protein
VSLSAAGVTGYSGRSATKKKKEGTYYNNNNNNILLTAIG